MFELSILLLNSANIYGGGEFFTFNCAKFLMNKGHNVYVSCPENALLKIKCQNEKIKVFTLEYPGVRKGKLGKIVGELKKIIKDNNIKIVHSISGYDRTAGAFATIGTKAVHAASVHSYYSIRRNITHVIRNKYYIKHFIASGEKIKELLIKKDNIPSEKITSINLGINPDEFKRDESIRKQIRMNFKLNDSDIVIGNVGRLVSFKGQENLIRAFRVINKKYQDTKLIIVGSGELESKLKNLCNELNINNNVIFTGFIDDLNEVYSAFDIYAHTSLRGTEELFPFAVLTAMAHGLPIVATNTGEINKMVLENQNGYLIEESKPELISGKIEKLLIDSAQSKSFGEFSLNHLRQNFTLEKMGDDIINIYNKIIS